MEPNYIKELHGLLISEATDLNENDVKIVLDQIANNEEKAKKAASDVQLLFLKARKERDIKINESAVPPGILSSNSSTILYDVRLASRGPDDKIYRQNKWIRENITRGMTFMETKFNDQCHMDLVIYANKKFLGGIGDDDESQVENDDVWREFCLQQPEDSSQIVCMKKVNGEAGHFSFRFIDGQFYLITGSKNVHMIIKDEQDIEKYTDSRYAIAKIVARSVMKALNKISLKNSKMLNLFKRLLDQTKMTVVCELTQPNYQHIVNLSMLKEPVVNFLMFTSTAEENKEDSFTALAPQYGLRLGKLFGFETASYESVLTKNLQNKIKEIRKVKGEEGCVFYFVTEDGKTIGLAKVKCAWYVMLRALREKATWAFSSKSTNSLNIDMIIKSTKKRYSQIQNWLKFDDSYLNNWEDVGERFLRWLQQKIKENHTEPSNIRPEFPIIWKSFLEETNSSDDFQYL